MMLHDYGWRLLFQTPYLRYLGEANQDFYELHAGKAPRIIILRRHGTNVVLWTLHTESSETHEVWRVHNILEGTSHWGNQAPKWEHIQSIMQKYEQRKIKPDAA